MPSKKENKSAGTLLQDMAHDSQIRTTERSKALRDGYEADLQEIEAKIEEKVAENNETLSDIRQDQLTRLLTLVRKRTAIETAIAESHTRLNRAYEVAATELRRSIVQRSNELERAVAAVGPDDTTGEEEDGGGDGENKENESPPPPGAKRKIVRGLKRRKSGEVVLSGKDSIKGVRR